MSNLLRNTLLTSKIKKFKLILTFMLAIAPSSILLSANILEIIVTKEDGDTETFTVHNAKTVFKDSLFLKDLLDASDEEKIELPIPATTLYSIPIEDIISIFNKLSGAGLKGLKDINLDNQQQPYLLNLLHANKLFRNEQLSNILTKLLVKNIRGMADVANLAKKVDYDLQQPLVEAIMVKAKFDPSFIFKNVSTPLQTIIADPINHLTALTALPNGELASASSGIPNINIWDSNGIILRTLIDNDNNSTIDALVTLANGNIISGSRNGIMTVWDAHKTTKLNSFQAAGNNPINSLIKLPNGNIAAASGYKIYVFDASIEEAHKKQYIEIPNYTGGANNVASLANNKLAFAANDETIKIADLTARTGKDYISNTGRVSAIAISKSGHLAFAAHGHDTIKVYDSNGNKIKEFNAYGDVTALTFLPYGNLLTVASVNHAGQYIIDIMDINSGKILKHLPTRSLVSSLVILPNGNLAAPSNNVINIWDLSELYKMAQELKEIDLEQLVVLNDISKNTGISDLRTHEIDALNRLAGITPYKLIKEWGSPIFKPKGQNIYNALMQYPNIAKALSPH